MEREHPSGVNEAVSAPWHKPTKTWLARSEAVHQCKQWHLLAGGAQLLGELKGQRPAVALR